MAEMIEMDQMGGGPGPAATVTDGSAPAPTPLHVHQNSEVVKSNPRMKNSPFLRERTRIRLHEKEGGEHGKHGWSLFWACLQLIVIFGDTVTDIYLIIWFLGEGHPLAAIGVIVAQAGTLLTEWFLDYAYRGRAWWLVFDVLRIRYVVEFFVYLRDWFQNRDHHWEEKDFRGDHPWRTFPGMYLSAVAQLHVLIQDDTDVGRIQVASMILSSLHALIALIHHFKYVTRMRGPWISMVTKALLSTSLRIFLAALLLEWVGFYVLVGAGISYIGGHIMVKLVYAKGRPFRRSADDPTKYRYNYAVFSHLNACLSVFVAVPFAPSHSVLEWWYGYMVADTKIQIENALIVGLTAALYDNDQDLLFWAGVAAASCLLLLNYIITYSLNFSVVHMLDIRGKYSNTLIVKLWANFVAYLRTGVKNLMITEVVDEDGDGIDDITGEPVQKDAVIDMEGVSADSPDADADAGKGGHELAVPLSASQIAAMTPRNRAPLSAQEANRVLKVKRELDAMGADDYSDDSISSDMFGELADGDVAVAASEALDVKVEVAEASEPPEEFAGVPPPAMEQGDNADEHTPPPPPPDSESEPEDMQGAVVSTPSAPTTKPPLPAANTEPAKPSLPPRSTGELVSPPPPSDPAPPPVESNNANSTNSSNLSFSPVPESAGGVPVPTEAQEDSDPEISGALFEVEFPEDLGELEDEAGDAGMYFPHVQDGGDNMFLDPPPPPPRDLTGETVDHDSEDFDFEGGPPPAP